MTVSIAQTFWNIPYERNPFFTGREDTLNHLDRALHAEKRVALSQPQGITGLGGIGKTQTVVEYAYRHRKNYNAVLWVRADSVASLISSMIELAQLLGLPERHEQNQELIVQAVLRWLRVNTNWLLIYDNIDNLSLAEPYLPKAAAGHLVFTTRAHALGGLAQRLDITQMEPDVGALLLLRRAKFLVPQANLSAAPPDEQQFAQAISQELDGLPLALDQAGAYIKETPCPLSEYLPRFQTRRSELLRTRGSFHQNYPASVATTWSLSFEKLSQAHPAAPELLNFCSFLAPDDIPIDFLTTEGKAHLGPLLAPVVTHLLQFDQVCQEILRFSLMQRGKDKETLTMHRLVQAVLRDHLSLGIQQHWMQQAVAMVESAYPGEDFTNWPLYERLLPHALICATWIEEIPLVTATAALLLNQAGIYLKDRGRYREAEPLLERTLAIREQVSGASHSDTAHAMNNLAVLYQHEGKYIDAEPLLQRALSIYQQTRGPRHSDTTRILNNLAVLYQYQGKYTTAESLSQQALTIYEQERGPDHLDTAMSLNNLAILYQQQGRYTQAESLQQRVLRLYEQNVGSHHPDTVRALNNLAELYCKQGKYAQAEPLLGRALVFYEQELGFDHPSTAMSLTNLADLYCKQGKYAQAEPLLERALAIFKQKAGPNHPETARALNNLGELYYNQGKYTEAEPLLQQAHAVQQQALDPLHPDIALSLNNLAALYRQQGKYTEAVPLLQQALTVYQQTLDPLHPDTIRTLNNLAMLYQNQERYTEAEPLLKQALAAYQQTLDPAHPNTAMVLNNLAMLYYNQERYTEAEPLLTQALAAYQETLGHFHPDTAMVLSNLAMLYSEQKKYVQAEPLLQQGLAISQQTLGPLHPEVAISLSNLAMFYNEQGKTTEAEPLLIRALAICEQQVGSNHPYTTLILGNLRELYRELDRDEEQELTRARAQADSPYALEEKQPPTILHLDKVLEPYRQQYQEEPETHPPAQSVPSIARQRLKKTQLAMQNFLKNYQAVLAAKNQSSPTNPSSPGAVAIPTGGASQIVSDDYLDVELVILLQGVKANGGEVYAYLQATGKKLNELLAAMQAGDFRPADFGTVIAGGLGQPSEEVRKDMQERYQMIDIQRPASQDRI